MSNVKCGSFHAVHIMGPMNVKECSDPKDAVCSGFGSSTSCTTISEGCTGKPEREVVVDAP